MPRYRDPRSGRVITVEGAEPSESELEEMFASGGNTFRLASSQGTNVPNQGTRYGGANATMSAAAPQHPYARFGRAIQEAVMGAPERAEVEGTGVGQQPTMAQMVDAGLTLSAPLTLPVTLPAEGMGVAALKAAGKYGKRAAVGATMGAGEEYVRGGRPGVGAVVGAAAGVGLPGAARLAGSGSLPQRLLRGVISEIKGATPAEHTAEELASFASARAEVKALEAAERAAAKTAKAEEAARFKAARDETKMLEASDRFAAQRAKAEQAAKAKKSLSKTEPKASQEELDAFAKSISATSPNAKTAAATARVRGRGAEVAEKHNALMSFGRQIAAENPKLGEKIWILLDEAGTPVKHLTPDQAAAAKRAGRQTTWVRNLWQGRAH